MQKVWNKLTFIYLQSIVSNKVYVVNKQEHQENTKENGQSLQLILLGKLDIHMQNNEIGHIYA